MGPADAPAPMPSEHPLSLGLRSDWQGNPWTLYDYAVASRGFAFWLDDADPQERGIIEEICRNGRFEPGAIVMGYAKAATTCSTSPTGTTSAMW